jgi:hypothetical protein
MTTSLNTSLESLDYIELGPVPYDEDASNFGVDPDFDKKNFDECTRFRNLLEKLFLPQLPNEDTHIRFFVKRFPYEGSYYREVCVEFIPEQNFSREFAYYIEANTPATWDDNEIDDFVMPS